MFYKKNKTKQGNKVMKIISLYGVVREDLFRLITFEQSSE